MPFNLTIPSTRGLSLALSRQLLLKSPYPLVATSRNAQALDDTKSRILDGLHGVDPGRVTVLHADVTDESTLSRAAGQVRSLFPQEDGEQTLCYAFSTAGMLHPERSILKIDAAKAEETLRINLLGPLLVMKHFSPFLPSVSKCNKEKEGDREGGDRPAVWGNVTARVGSIADNHKGGWYSYRSSKAGLNQATKTLDIELSFRNGGAAMAVALHPGTVKTGLNKEFWGSVPKEKLFEPDFAAERILEVVMGLTLEDRGRFFDWKGERIEW